jgi:hypothetical protein
MDAAGNILWAAGSLLMALFQRSGDVTVSRGHGTAELQAADKIRIPNKLDVL